MSLVDKTCYDSGPQENEGSECEIPRKYDDSFFREAPALLDH
jgi:hypothetical protein